ncbi:GGDEF domain-containing protein [Marinomonas sp. 15G1-11]|uniref:diguanylate cyclase n=1 Tax=Marinomonas phaeophyticola TaxID=3004091 RepID=A0ABT4JXL0_9GAMM|nr:GGDEF domain-containing protein [Marinomonas sp. 15G1-11]MCZ2723013.1 GGDEF domain-containing protein [Marinomonas sp. 15G1-11]
MKYFSKKIDDILYSGITDRSDDSLYYLQIINLSYILSLSGIAFLCVFFVFVSQWPIVWFQMISVFIGIMGFRLNLKGFHSKSAVFLPFFLIGYLLISSFFFIGANSDLHWATSLYPIYSFTVFQRKHYLKRIYLVLLGSIGFFLCEFIAPETSILVTPQQQVWLSAYTFCISMIFASLIMNLLISRLIKANQHLKHLAEVDELTGISNRRKVLADAVDVFAGSSFNGKKCSFAIIDLDHFKKINDTYGHDAGDLVLREVAQQMATKMDASFKLGRYGGEEFVIVMPDTDVLSAEQSMEAMRANIEDLQIETKQGIVVPVTVSIGISSINFNTMRYEEVLSEADQALYLAKDEGRNRVKTYSIY